MMYKHRPHLHLMRLTITLLIITLSFSTYAAPHKIAIVSSYHPEFLWTSETNEGVFKALREDGYSISNEQEQSFIKDNFLETKELILRKWWMDSKRKSSLPEIQKEVTRIIGDLEQFKPSIVMTGDDNATNYLGNYYIDSSTPLVFWGVNGSPMKYGLLDSLSKPGRNITGVYQADYLKESVLFLKELLPQVKSLTILSDDSVSSRAKLKKLQRLYNNKALPVKITHTIVTNKAEEWKKEALKASEKTDAFFMLNHNTLKNKKGEPVDSMKLGAWYIRNIKKPEVSYEQHFIVEGMFAAVSDSGVKQGYGATKLANKILKGESPSLMAVTAPIRGDYVVNRERAKMLGVYKTIKNNKLIEAWVEKAIALEKYKK
ncbi:MAG: ABC transporter substrate-binding protein [Cellvibrionaceae bacterium]